MKVLFLSDDPEAHAIVGDLFDALDGFEAVSFHTASEALMGLRKAAPDAVLVDGAMSEIDARSLLRSVRTRAPGVARLLWCTPGEADAAMSWAPDVEQFALRNAPLADLQDMLERTAASRARFGGARVAAVVSSLGRVPPVPGTYQAVRHALNEGQPPNQVIEAVERSPVVAARLLQLANSAAFGLPRTVHDVGQAVSLLGLLRVRDIVLAIEVGESMGLRNGVPGWPRVTIAALQDRAVLLAAVVRELFGSDDLAATAGLFSQFGPMLFTAYAPGAYAKVLDAVEGRPGPERRRVEAEVFGASADEVGAWLLASWGIPDPVVDCVLGYRTPADQGHDAFGAIDALHVAAGLVDQLTDGVETLDHPHLERLGVLPVLDEWTVRAEGLVGPRRQSA